VSSFGRWLGHVLEANLLKVLNLLILLLKLPLHLQLPLVVEHLDHRSHWLSWPRTLLRLGKLLRSLNCGDLVPDDRRQIQVIGVVHARRLLAELVLVSLRPRLALAASI